MIGASGSGTKRVDLRGACPIPLGHRVEVRTFLSQGGSGFFGGGPPEPRWDSPLLTDLETGVRYGATWQFMEPLAIYDPAQLMAPGDAPLPTLQEHSRWVGRVLLCNVLTTGMRSNEIQTTLILQPLPPGEAYR
jgi:hypothetical protein